MREIRAIGAIGAIAIGFGTRSRAFTFNRVEVAERDARQETDIARQARLARKFQSPIIKTPGTEKREIQWKRNGHASG